VEGEPFDQRQGSRVSQLLDPVAIGQAKDQDRDTLEAAERLLDCPDRQPDLAVVDPAAQLDQLHLGCPAEQEVGIDRDAVAADAEARLVDVAVGLAVGRRDHFLDVDTYPVGVTGKLVGQGDVHVAVGGVGQLAELGGFGRAHQDDFGVEDRAVEGRRPGARFGAQAADQLGIHGQVLERRPAVQPLGREGDEEVLLEAQAADRGQPWPEATAGVADRQGGLEDDRRARMDARCDRLDRRVHVAIVGLLLVVEHDRHDQHDHVGAGRGRSSVECCPQAAGGVGRSDALGQAGLLGHVIEAGVDRVDDRGLDVDRGHVPAVAGELDGERQAHLAGAHDRHPPDRAGGARPGRDSPRLGVLAGAGGQLDRAAKEAGGDR
jgi:hypothetical protein